jgi:hypothetical protein
VSGIVLSGYEVILVVWGVSFMLLGTAMMYFLHRIMAADERQTESAPSAPVAKADDRTGHSSRGIAA